RRAVEHDHDLASPAPSPRDSCARWRWYSARSALARADRGVGLHQQSVRPTLVLWVKPSPDGLCLGSRECGRLRRAFNDFRRLTGSRREHGLDGLDGLLDLLVAHRLDAPAVLDFHFARHQKRKNLEVRGRLVTSDLLDRLLA